MTGRHDYVGYFKKWAAVKAGSTEYDSSEFAFFLNDLHPALFEDLFGELPAGDEFIARLNQLIADHLDMADLDVAKAGTDTNQLTMGPLPENGVTPSELISIAQRDVAQRVAVLKHADEHEEVTNWEIDRFEYLEQDRIGEITNVRAPYPDPLNSVIRRNMRGGHWLSCLEESAYYLIGNNRALQPWLLKGWSDLPVDFEPTYELWRAGGGYRFRQRVCLVYSRYSIPDTASGVRSFG